VSFIFVQKLNSGCVKGWPRQKEAPEELTELTNRTIQALKRILAIPADGLLEI
jgi:hypothetical protein